MKAKSRYNAAAMKLSHLALLTASALLTTFAITGCSVDAAEPTDSEDGEEVGQVEDELAAARYVGTWDWRAVQSGGYVGFSEIQLKAGGSYEAQVDMPPEIGVCIHFPCTMSETGTWSSFVQNGKQKIRLKPQAKPARVYTVALSVVNKTLTFTRLGQTAKHFKRASLTCANVRCGFGTVCQMVNGSPQCMPNHPPPLNFCVKTGCSGQICAPSHMASTCEWRPEYACYDSATCAPQANGQCGWTQTPALTACLAANQ
jgi:hypothetical protein